jgi:hypothetical protein
MKTLIRMRFLLAALLGLATLSACSAGGECTYDTDCPGTEVCLGGECVYVVPDGGEKGDDRTDAAVDAQDGGRDDRPDVEEAADESDAAQDGGDVDGCSSQDDCDDGNPCTRDDCVDAVCINQSLESLSCDASAPGAGDGICVAGVCTRCTRIEYDFTAFTPDDFSQSSPVPFGTEAYTYEQLPWMKDPATSYPPGTRRQAGYRLYSKDCGITWYRSSDYVPPLKLLAPADAIGNGVGHFVSHPDANPLSQGYVTYLRIDNFTSRIYPVFRLTDNWAYQALLDQAEPLPVIGSRNSSSRDNLYSPSIVVNTGDADGSIQLYFGGWRSDYTLGPIPECDIPDRGMVILEGGYTEKICQCHEYKHQGWALDACTGDKIFVASNFQQPNPLSFRVYQGGVSWSPDGWSSDTFEPVIWAQLLNTNCVPSTCPYPLVHTNDPSVVRTKHPTSPMVMYFTGGLWDVEFVAYTHVARSTDGLNWEDFAILRAGPGLSFPADLTYNNANGTVRAFFDPFHDLIRLLLVTTPDHPQIPQDHPDAWKVFVFDIDPAEPDVVLSMRKIDSIPHSLKDCQPGGTVPCAVSTPYGR